MMPERRARLRRPWVQCACLIMLVAGPVIARAGTVGFERVRIARQGGVPLDAAFWYPSDAPETLMHLSLSDQPVARDGPLTGRGLTLVAISPGTLGSWEEHADTAWALAKAGFVVVSATPDEVTAQGKFKLADRAGQLGDVIDFALHHWRAAALERSQAVGIFGFSLGGFTALVSAGGRPDPALMRSHCRQVLSEWSCTMQSGGRLDPDDLASPGSGLRHGARVGALVVAAPALGAVFGRAGLAPVGIPVQLWQAGDDDVLAEPWNAQAVKRDLPDSPEFHLVAGAAHGDFTAPCAAENRYARSRLCTDATGFSRSAFHEAFNSQVVRFFRQWLGHGGYAGGVR